MASMTFLTWSGNSTHRYVSGDNTTDFLSIKIGASGLEIKETSGTFDFGGKKLANIAAAVEGGQAVELTQFLNEAFLKVDKSTVGIPSGVASLDNSGWVPATQLPPTLLGALIGQGPFSAAASTPPATPTKGFFYVISEAGVINGVDYQIGDWIWFDGIDWNKVDNTDLVSSVNGETGSVTLTTTNVTEGTNQYFTVDRAKAAAVVNSMAGTELDQAPSVVAAKAADADILTAAKTYVDQNVGASAASLRWKANAFAATSDPRFASVADGTALSSLLPFSDDDAPQMVIGDFHASDYILVKAGTSSKLWQLDASLNLTASTAPALGDTWIVENDLPATPASNETVALYNYNGSDVVRIGSFAWNAATGINLSLSYVSLSSVVSAGDSIETAIAKLDGNTAAEKTRATNAEALLDSKINSGTPTITLQSSASGTLVAPNFIYMKSDGTVDLADNTAAGIFDSLIGIVVAASIATTGTGAVCVRPGTLLMDTLTGLTPGAKYFLGTAGAITTTAPASGAVIQMGYAAGANLFVFQPIPIIDLT